MKNKFRPPTEDELQETFLTEAIRNIAEENQLGVSRFRLVCLAVRAKGIRNKGYIKTDQEMNN